MNLFRLSVFACVISISQPLAAKKPTEDSTYQTAMLAGGCFWGVEELMRKHHGVIDTEVGYTGGFSTSAKYEEVKTGKTGHAEAVKITFDPNVISYAKILEYFFRIHDPTTINRQGNDIGSQYRSAIFYLSEEQKDVAKKIVSKVNATNFWKSEVVTEIVPSGLFIKAEEYHQKYLQKKPDGYTCHYERPFNFETKRP